MIGEAIRSAIYLFMVAIQHLAPMAEFSIFRPAYPTDRCYLIEVLYWRAFGRLPEDHWDDDRPWRFSAEIRDSFEAPVPEGRELYADECRFAGISEDPRMNAILEDTPSMGTDYYEMLLEMAEGFDPRDPEREAQLRKEIAEAGRYEGAVQDWLPYFEEYVDEFKNEICLDLRRGTLVALATELPAATCEETERILEERRIWLDDFPVASVPKGQWISSAINWDDSAIYGRERSFIWIHFNVDEILKLYPPQRLVDPQKVFPIGSSVAIVDAIATGGSTGAKKGRPPLPWDQFHVEVARLYANGDMPRKKEAAIATLQEWFSQMLGKNVSRSAIGARLKSYFDAIELSGKK